MVGSRVCQLCLITVFDRSCCISVSIDTEAHYSTASEVGAAYSGTASDVGTAYSGTASQVGAAYSGTA